MKTLVAIGLVLSVMILVTPDTFAQRRGGGGQRGMRGRSANGCQGQMTQQRQMRNRYGMMGQRGGGRGQQGSSSRGRGGNFGAGQRRADTEKLEQQDADSILLLREEEKLARDVYLALAETWNAPIFTNIAESEQQHMDAVGQLIEKYGLIDPITDDTPGVFTNDTLQGLYDGLVSSDDVDLTDLELGLVIQGGGASLLAAYKVGAFIEEFDIERAIFQTSHSDIENIYENLVRRSRNHLRSFVGQIDAAGEDYQPVMMIGIDDVTGQDLDALYEEIITGDQETANGRESGRQKGQRAGSNSRAALEPTALVADQVFAEYGRRFGRRR